MDDDLDERPDDDDYDLLTFGEAGARLRGAIRRETSRLAELDAVGAGHVDSRSRSAIVSRLSMLREAMIRNSKVAGDS